MKPLAVDSTPSPSQIVTLHYLSNSQLTNYSTYSPAPNNNRGTPRKLPSTTQRNNTGRSPLRNFKTKTQRLTNHNPQEPNRDKEETRHIPTSVMNDVPNVNPTIKKNNSLVQHQTMYIYVPSIIYVKLLKPKQQRTRILN